MTKENLIKWWDVIEAQKEGKKIQAKHSGETDWYDTSNPSYFANIEYRLKPEPELIPYDFSDSEMLIGKIIRHKETATIRMILAVTQVGVETNNGHINFFKLLDIFTSLDGKPLGKIQE